MPMLVDRVEVDDPGNDDAEDEVSVGCNKMLIPGPRTDVDDDDEIKGVETLSFDRVEAATRMDECDGIVVMDSVLLSSVLVTKTVEAGSVVI